MAVRGAEPDAGRKGAGRVGARPGRVPPDVVAWPWEEARDALEAGGWRVRRRLTGAGVPAEAGGRVERVVAVRLAGGDQVEAVVAAFPAGEGRPAVAAGPPTGGGPGQSGPGAAASHAPQGDPGGALPRHVAIIMDGNRRWARQHGSDTDTGHRAGVVSLRGIVRVCSRLGIGYLTCYALSTENWKRSEGEVNGLWSLASEFLRTELPELIRQGVRVRIIGDRRRLPLLVRQAAAAAEAATAGNRGLVLTLALNYGARQEIVSAARALCGAVAAGRLRPEDVDADAFAAHLETAGLPDPDLLIRTSGERRISNFLLWQIAYSEIWMTDALWPDFGEADLLAALEDYRRRDRRFGGGPAAGAPGGGPASGSHRGSGAG